MIFLIILIIVIAIISYAVYFIYKNLIQNIVDEEVEAVVDDSDPIREIMEYQANLNKRVNLNTQISQKLVDYLVKEESDEFDHESASRTISSNEDKIEQNKLRIAELSDKNEQYASTLKAVEDNIAHVQRTVRYETNLVMAPFMKEYGSKYGVTNAQKSMLLETNLFGLVDPVVMQCFNGVTPIDITTKHKDAAFELIQTLLNDYQVMNYGVTAKNVNRTFYESRLPAAYTYANLHHHDIDLSKHAEFMLTSYLPRLISYVNNNIASIIENVDQIMLDYFAHPRAINTHFNEFLTDMNVEDFIYDESHLFTVVAKHAMRMLYTEEDVSWMAFKRELGTRFTPSELKLLLVLIPEFVIMVKYDMVYFNYTHRLPYENLIRRYFLNNLMLERILSSRDTLTIQNMNSMLARFKCSEWNTRSVVLKRLLQQDTNSYFFENIFLVKMNALLRRIGRRTTMAYFTCASYEETHDEEDEEEEEEESTTTPPPTTNPPYILIEEEIEEET